MVSTISRIDSKDVIHRLNSSIIYGNSNSLNKMVNFSKLLITHNNSDVLSGLDFMPTILLYGPPNTGKTTLVYRLLNELKSINNNTDLYYLNFSNVMSSDYGGTSKNLVSAFDELKIECSIENPSILLIDELDQFCMSRSKANEHDASRRAMSALMLELDQLHPSNCNGLIVVAITNVQDKIDNAIIRRFNQKLKISETLEYEDFKSYLKEMVSLVATVELTEVETSEIYGLYKERNLTIPDVKGCFRNILIECKVDSSNFFNKLKYEFENCYSSVINVLE